MYVYKVCVCDVCDVVCMCVCMYVCVSTIGGLKRMSDPLKPEFRILWTAYYDFWEPSPLEE